MAKTYCFMDFHHITAHQRFLVLWVTCPIPLLSRGYLLDYPDLSLTKGVVLAYLVANPSGIIWLTPGALAYVCDFRRWNWNASFICYFPHVEYTGIMLGIKLYPLGPVFSFTVPLKVAAMMHLHAILGKDKKGVGLQVWEGLKKSSNSACLKEPDLIVYTCLQSR